MSHQATVARLKVLLIVAVTIGGLALLLCARSRRSGVEQTTINSNQSETAGAGLGNSSPRPALSPVPTFTSPQAPMPSPQTQNDLGNEKSASLEANRASQEAMLAGNYVGTLKLIIPVVGVKPDQLRDTFVDARSEGRVHDAIDIPAPAGTPVVAAADGEIIRLFQSERGGTTIYQFSADKKLVFYYAHLQGYAEGLAAGKFVHQGEVIGYVGDTGNAGTGNYHLHFSVSVIADPKRYWEGANINPYPLLRK